MNKTFLPLWLGAVLAGCGGGGGGGDADGGAGSDGGGARAVGGTVTGLYGTLVLENNGGDDLPLTESGSFQFATGLADGAGYEVTIKSQAGAVCTVEQGSGTVDGADVSDVAVSCLDLIAFTSGLALDGSLEEANTNLTANAWVVAADGTGLAPLTELTAAGAGAFGAAWSPDGTRLLFSSSRALNGADENGATANIWIMNADGTALEALTTLTASGTSCYDPKWSPDGGQIIFYSARALDGSDAAIGVWNLWIMNADGSDQTALTENTMIAAGYAAAWSPDGTRVAWQSNQALGGQDTGGSQSNIWVLPLDGSLPATPITHGVNSSSYHPVWSPDGTKIAFESDRRIDGDDEINADSNTNVWVTNPNGTGTEARTALTSAQSFVAGWSPDGQQILYRSTRSLDGEDSAIGYNVWVMDADGDNSQPLTMVSAQTVTAATFSPDGELIVFDSSRALDGSDMPNDNATRNIWLMHADGSDQTPLTMGTASQATSYQPSWVR